MLRSRSARFVYSISYKSSHEYADGIVDHPGATRL